MLMSMILACSAEKGPMHPIPYAVGSSTRFIHDPSRNYGAVSEFNSGIRTLITEIWYPVSHGAVADGQLTYRRATYDDYVFGNRQVHRLMMTKTTFFHLTPDSVREGVTEKQIDAAIEELFHRECLSYVDAPLSESEQPFPVVVMSHGNAGSRYNMESACEYLAAHGYVVIAPEHTGNSPYSMTGSDPALAEEHGDSGFREKMSEVLQTLGEQDTYGSEENFGQSYTPLSNNGTSSDFLARLDQSLLQRLNDLRATLDELDRMDAEGPFAGRLNLDRVGLMDRSFGGATTLMGLSTEDRFTAGFSVVPPGWSDLRTILPPEMLKPAGQESVLLSSEGPYPLIEISKPTLILSGAEDDLIIGFVAATAESAGTTAPSPENQHPILRQSYERTESPVVWGLLADSNHSICGVSGGYWWPELKPDSQMRYFEPTQSFKLIAPAIAHKMQQELALAFFDLTIKQDQSARQRLLDNRHESYGLTLESRNL